MKLLIIVMLPWIAFAEAKLNINNVLLTGFERHEEHRLETHSTEKRGWASVILYGTSILVRTTSVGLSIAAAVTEGCSYYPSICHDKDAIEDLDKEIQSMKDQFDQMYKKVAQEWVNLRYVSTNNGYINFYVDEAIKHVQNLSDFQSLIVDELKLNVPDLFKIYEASQNLTSETYLEVLIGRLDLQLSDITKMLEEQRDNVLIGLAAQMMIETGLNSFVNSYSNAYKQVRLDQEFESELDAVWTALTKADAADAEILLDQQHPEYEQVMTKYGLKSSKITKTVQVKMAPKVVSKMFQNAKEAGSDALGKLSSWERVKGTIKTKLSSTATKLSETTEFFTSSAALKYQVSNFKMSWSTTIMTSLGIIADAITTAIEIAQWKKVADQMEEAREEYEEYRDNLKAEIENLEAEEANVTEQWKINIELFKELSKAFGELIEKSNNASDFVDVIGLPRSPVSSDNAIMKINFDDINKENLADTQDVVIQFLRDIDNDLNLVVDQTRALYILYSNVREQTDAGETATEILSELLDIFNFNPSIIVRDFGNSLQKKDIVCTISILLIHLTEYDYYQLSPFQTATLAILHLTITNMRLLVRETKA